MKRTDALSQEFEFLAEQPRSHQAFKNCFSQSDCLYLEIAFVGLIAAALPTLSQGEASDRPYD